MIRVICEHCEKKIEAYNQKQADHLLKIHIISKHYEAYKEEIMKDYPKSQRNKKTRENASD